MWVVFSSFDGAVAFDAKDTVFDPCSWRCS